MGGNMEAIVFATSYALFTIIFVLFLLVFSIIVNWKIFKKAGEAGWKCLIPIYGSYIQYKIAGVSIFFWITLAITVVSNLINLGLLAIPLAIVNFVLSIIYIDKLAKSFGKGTAFALGLIFLPLIFLPILAFGKAQYVGTKK